MIAVIGGTGTTGGELLRLLSTAGVAVRALTRDPAGAPRLAGVQWAAADLKDPRATREALSGVDALFLLTGNTSDMVRLQRHAVDGAAAAGVSYVVKLSALGATDHSRSVIGLWHYNVERRLREAGPGWTILRPHHFMQNLLEASVFDRATGRAHSASGEGKIPFIDTRDIAAVAATLLLEFEGARSRGEPAASAASRSGDVLTLTGPRAVSYREATTILSEVLGERLPAPLEFIPETPDENWRRRRAAGDPTWLVAAQLEIARYQREGGATERVTDTVAEITGRPALTLRDFARAYADRLVPDS